MKFFLTIIFSFIINVVFSQTTTTISMSKMNVAFLGIRNPATVMIENTPCDSIYLSTNNGRFEKDYCGCCYWYFPLRIGKAEVYIHKSNVIDTINVDTLFLRVKPIPEKSIKARLNISHRLNTISRELLLHSKGIVVELINWDISLLYEVSSFDVEFVFLESSYLTHNIGGEFDADALKGINMLKKADQIIIKNIVILDYDKKERKISDKIKFIIN